MCEIAMTIPDESLAALAESPEEASAELRMLAAVKMFGAEEVVVRSGGSIGRHLARRVSQAAARVRRCRIRHDRGRTRAGDPPCLS